MPEALTHGDVVYDYKRRFCQTRNWDWWRFERQVCALLTENVRGRQVRVHRGALAELNGFDALRELSSHNRNRALRLLDLNYEKHKGCACTGQMIATVAWRRLFLGQFRGTNTPGALDTAR